MKKDVIFIYAAGTVFVLLALVLTSAVIGSVATFLNGGRICVAIRGLMEPDCGW